MNGLKALIIEDDESLGMLFAELLHEMAYETEVLSNGRIALERLDQTVPDLILLDLNLPIVSGPAILQSIRSSPRLKQVPTIVITASPRMLDGETGSLASTVLVKPIDLTQFRKLVSRFRQLSQRETLAPDAG